MVEKGYMEGTNQNTKDSHLFTPEASFVGFTFFSFNLKQIL